MLHTIRHMSVMSFDELESGIPYKTQLLFQVERHLVASAI